MVEINSFTGNREGVNALAALTATAFEPLGFTAESVPPADPEHGDHLVLTRGGATAGNDEPPLIGLVSHLDTVFPLHEEELHDFRWRELGDRIYGPGTVDIKGGTVVLYMVLDALRAVVPEIFAAVRWRVLLDSAEERGAPDFGTLCRERLAGARACLVFEGGPLMGEEGGTVVVARKGIGVFTVRAEGRAAHAGSGPEYGANAIVQLAEVVGKIAGWTDLERGLSFNVGVIRGGVSTNRVPHEAEAEVEMRAFTPEVYAEGLAKILALDGTSTVRSAADGYPCAVSVRTIIRKPPWPRNEGSAALARLWMEAGAEVGFRMAEEARGGLSDGNETWSTVPTLDGLGPDGGNAHASECSADGRKDQEYMVRTSLVPKALINALAVLRLVGARPRR